MSIKGKRKGLVVVEYVPLCPLPAEVSPCSCVWVHDSSSLFQTSSQNPQTFCSETSFIALKVEFLKKGLRFSSSSLCPNSDATASPLLGLQEGAPRRFPLTSTCRGLELFLFRHFLRMLGTTVLLLRNPAEDGDVLQRGALMWAGSKVLHSNPATPAGGAGCRLYVRNMQ